MLVTTGWLDYTYITVLADVNHHYMNDWRPNDIG